MPSVIKLLPLSVAFFGAISVHANSVNEIEQLINKWLSIENQTSQLESHWLERKSSMSQNLVILEAEQQQLKALTERRKKNSTELTKKREQLITQQAQLELDQQQLEDQLNTISQRLLSLQVQLPPPLLNSWHNVGDLTDPQLSSTEKLQMALKMLTLLTEFQQRISIHEMAIEHPDGQDIWVKQLYLGAAQAWFVSEDLTYVGTGFASELGWQWEFDPSIDAQQVAQGIAMQQKQRPADWLTLPILSYKSATQSEVNE
ncbi:DUF3450 family protein [Pseudoalteromonas sp. MMG010]|uniref:DUF3450 family protein n=1 Tax=Pseudoalteromonas sp. MMG010 TaxID=2822685 RepID=UPI001B3A755C|nr:DUF3450 family protein [Pseudoalteromonas sp. MMG010]MBQ4832770.1 DUF3450 family protein [Pseudoalteromonas sp. MMG010]